ncbi:acyl-CoA thioesterase [Candidatus Laterigemmans baculatus]|uniref:acyl-CoA thioesterase n=1 Tax=Candidatus Laterigemmans baculatus TaxID=2770505 RepID=UPI001F2CBE64|nr:acyl-CoA thioesterase [Candidatus Laterigemmans baculatus]
MHDGYRFGAWIVSGRTLYWGEANFPTPFRASFRLLDWPLTNFGNWDNGGRDSLGVGCMTAYFDVQHTVEPEEIDAQGHVHNLRYIAWTLRAAGLHSAALGWNAQEMLDRFGSGWVVRSHDVVYRLAALEGDELVIRTWITDVAKHAAVRRSVICRMSDRKVLARVRSRWVMVDLRVRKAIQIPAEVASRIEVLAAVPPMPWEAGA